MRPEILYSLFASHKTLSGVGPKLAKILEKLAGPFVLDLLWHLPQKVLKRQYVENLQALPVGEHVTFEAVVGDHYAPPSMRGKKLPHRVNCFGSKGTPITLVFFKADGGYLKRLLPTGEKRLISGKVDQFKGHFQITHPDFVGSPASKNAWQGVEPLYGLTYGLTSKNLQKFMALALKRVPELPEWIEEKTLKKYQWPSWREALFAAHHPTSEQDLWAGAPVRSRLAYDELLANQLTFSLMRESFSEQKGEAVPPSKELFHQGVGALPFTLTGAQQQAIAEIREEICAPKKMIRLLQGDVGSGKTIVAFLSMLDVIESGGQAAIIAPTEILARQHYTNIKTLAEKLGISVGLALGKDKAKERSQFRGLLSSGAIHIAIGTHALIQEDVVFKNLKLAVIDEQHRFGVAQRLALVEKGQDVNVLLMTATPIPRTLMLTAYGDLEVSRLLEKPANRKPIQTRVMSTAKIEELITNLKRAVQEGQKVYWVCPLVEESEVLDFTAAADRAKDLKKQFGDEVGLIHGQLSAEVKEQEMQKFLSGETKILVATTVIEVGVDVRDATIMIIEHAERFGLSQLHQLRGRIGRGDKQSSCVLLYEAPLSEIAKTRLSIMRESEDGFKIAEEDLKLRGSGDLLGVRQSGIPNFKLADPFLHGDLLRLADEEAKRVIKEDPYLKSDRGKALRILLYLFEKENALKYLTSG